MRSNEKQEGLSMMPAQKVYGKNMHIIAPQDLLESIKKKKERSPLSAILLDDALWIKENAIHKLVTNEARLKWLDDVSGCLLDLYVPTTPYYAKKTPKIYIPYTGIDIGNDYVESILKLAQLLGIKRNEMPVLVLLSALSDNKIIKIPLHEVQDDENGITKLIKATLEDIEQIIARQLGNTVAEQLVRAEKPIYLTEGERARIASGFQKLIQRRNQRNMIIDLGKNVIDTALTTWWQSQT